MTSPNPPRPTVAEVLDKLAAHGSARQIADHLSEAACTGIPQSSSTCPVARWVHRQTGDRITIGPSTWGLSAAPRDLDAPEPTTTSEGSTPDVVGDFIAAFDDGAFPELDLPRQLQQQIERLQPGGGG